MNHVYLLLDASTSMVRIQRETVNAFNTILTGVQVNPKALVSLQTFSTTPHKPMFLSMPAIQVPKLDYYQYKPDGWTALWDAGKAAIDNLKVKKRDTALIIFITDGEPQQSKMQAPEFVELMNAREENWTFVFQVPKGYGDRFSNRFRISRENVSEWEQTDIGTQKMSEVTSNAITDYYSELSKGIKATKSFFKKVVPDLSNIQVKKELDNLAGKYWLLTVDQQDKIAPFIEAKTGAYSPGCAFYQLMKPEKVQASKSVLIMERGKKTVYGGPDARTLIGLPNFLEARIVPGNHANYDIFIQSKSYTRILSRGTKVLVQK